MGITVNRIDKPRLVLLVGIAAGMLLAGLVLPLAVGDRQTTLGTGAALTPPSGPSTAAVAETVAGTASTVPNAVVPGAVAVNRNGVPAAPARTGGTAPSVGGRLSASDVGVTATAVQVGVIILDLQTANAVGLAPDNYEVETQRRAYQAFFDDLNARGGVLGRNVEPIYVVADPFDEASGRAACLTLTEDRKVFAALSMPGYGGADALCVTREHKTPLLALSLATKDSFDQAGGRLVTDLQQAERMMFNWVDALHQLEALRGRTIGIVGDDAPGGDREAGDALVIALQRYGYRVAYRARLSEDLQTGASQIPVEVSRMRGAGVDTVFLATNFVYSLQWAQAADAQGWRLQYFTSDLQGMATDALSQNMPPSFDGAIGVVSLRLGIIEARDNLPEAPIDKACRELFNRAPGEDFPYGSTNPVLFTCLGVRLFEVTASAAGPDLTRDRFVAALQALGPIELPGSHGGGFRPGKTDYGDNVRPIRWSIQCRCYHIAGPPRKGAFS